MKLMLNVRSAPIDIPLTTTATIAVIDAKGKRLGEKLRAKIKKVLHSTAPYSNSASVAVSNQRNDQRRRTAIINHSVYQFAEDFARSPRISEKPLRGLTIQVGLSGDALWRLGVRDSPGSCKASSHEAAKQ